MPYDFETKYNPHRLPKKSNFAICNDSRIPSRTEGSSCSSKVAVSINFMHETPITVYMDVVEKANAFACNQMQTIGDFTSQTTRSNELPTVVDKDNATPSFVPFDNQNHFPAGKNIINDRVKDSDTCGMTSTVYCQKNVATCQDPTDHIHVQPGKRPTQSQRSRQKKFATKVNYSRKKEVEANRKEICTLPRDAAKTFNNNNGQDTFQPTAVAGDIRSNKAPGKDQQLH
nr:hypothetical protein [Tanacetum cinerariifolium]